jgi:hypothetical protein
MWVKIFLSTVSDEFRRCRDVLRSDLTRHNVEVKVQEDFTDLGGETLDKLDVYIAHCDAVMHLVGDMTGAYPGERGLSALLAKYPDLPAKLLPLGAALKDGSGLSYTQWEAWLALYHHKLLLIAEAEEAAERELQYAQPMPRAPRKTCIWRALVPAPKVPVVQSPTRTARFRIRHRPFSSGAGNRRICPIAVIGRGSLHLRI